MAKCLTHQTSEFDLVPCRTVYK